MPTITLSVTEELKKHMDEFREINWSEISRKAIAEKIKRLMILKKLDKALENSELNEEDCLRLGNKIKEAAWKKYKKKGW